MGTVHAVRHVYTFTLFKVIALLNGYTNNKTILRILNVQITISSCELCCALVLNITIHDDVFKYYYQQLIAIKQFVSYFCIQQINGPLDLSALLLTGQQYAEQQ